MASLVDGYCLLLGISHNLGLLLKTADDTVNGIEEILLAHRLAVMSRGDKCRLIAHVSDVGTRESRCLTSQEVDVQCLISLHGFEMHLEDCLTLVEVGQIDVYLSVESSCAHQSRVEHVGTVGGGKDNHTAIGAEAVHLGEQGIQSVFALVVASHGRVLASCSSHGVDLVDEDNTR